MTERVFHHVALPLPRTGPLTYIHYEGIEPGVRVLVPLGKRIVTGTVVAKNTDPFDGAKTVVEVLDETPALPADVLELTRRIAEYYLCSWGESIDAALPVGLTPTSVIHVSLTSEVDDDMLSTMARTAPRRAQLLDVLRMQSGDVTVDFLQKQLNTTTVAHQLDALQRLGLLSVELQIERERGPRLVQALRINEMFAANESLVKETFDKLDSKAPKQSLLLGTLYLKYHNKEGAAPAAQLIKSLGVTQSAVNALIDKGLIIEERVVQRPDDDDDIPSLAQHDETNLSLTSEQQIAAEAITATSGAFAPFLLEGITGSGKTIVYERVMRTVLSQGKTCLLLVPEISLTPQLHDRFKAWFGNSVALLHSGMAIGERITTWKRIRDGELPIVIGARSAVFAPLDNVGVIIVDEEHEPSYKQNDPSPRYHGRDAAVMRAQLAKCPVVLGSATPSLESIYNVQQGRYRHVVLSQRIDGASLPEIQVVDMRERRRESAVHGILSKDLLTNIFQRIPIKQGVILFLNRRGYATQIQCEDCGTVPQCPNCDVALTWHKSSRSLRCHYCGHHEAAHTACKTCGGVQLNEAGFGTQRVEEDLNSAMAMTPELGTINVERADTDTMRRRGMLRSLLTRFAHGNVDVVIGTQMIGKGLDIPRVSLVGVVNADQSLYHSDFRAAERTVQLLVQVSGRAGRKSNISGKVIVQTSSPEHPAILASVSADRSQWLNEELRHRKELSYPPFSRFIVVECSGSDEKAVEHAANVVWQLLTKNDPAMTVLPPVPPAIARLRNRYRRMIVIKNHREADPAGIRFRQLMSSALDAYYKDYARSSVRVTVDVDSSGGF